MKKLVLIALALCVAGPALAERHGGGPRVQPIADATTAKECSACHLAFQPEFLPARSWKKLMEPGQLANHFGDDASLPEATRVRIEAYLMQNAAGVASGRESSKVAGSVGANETPLRLTDTQIWQRRHRASEVNPARFQDAKVKSKANCQACHKDAAKGVYEDEDEREGGFWRR